MLTSVTLKEYVISYLNHKDLLDNNENNQITSFINVHTNLLNLHLSFTYKSTFKRLNGLVNFNTTVILILFTRIY